MGISSVTMISTSHPDILTGDFFSNHTESKNIFGLCVSKKYVWQSYYRTCMFDTNSVEQ